MGTKLSTHFSSINSAASRTAQYSTFYISHTHKGGSEWGGKENEKGGKRKRENILRAFGAWLRYYYCVMQTLGTLKFMPSSVLFLLLGR